MAFGIVIFFRLFSFAWFTHPLNPLPRGDFFIPLHGGAALFPSWEGTGMGLIAFTPIRTIQYKFWVNPHEQKAHKRAWKYVTLP